jgi:hypothetical protein
MDVTHHQSDKDLVNLLINRSRATKRGCAATASASFRCMGAGPSWWTASIISMAV